MDAATGFTFSCDHVTIPTLSVGWCSSMKRRSVLLGASSIVVARTARAASGCFSMSVMGPVCRVYVEQPKIVKQHCAQWCWAASAAMIFAMHDHAIDQQDIVQAVFRQAICLPSPNIIIAGVLSSNWTDQNGDSFDADIQAAYDYSAGIHSIDNDFIINELNNDRPLLYGNGHHAMVLSQAEFINTSNGPLIQKLGVFDPWPWSPDFHDLSPPEIVPAHLGGQMNFLAAVNIS